MGIKRTVPFPPKLGENVPNPAEIRGASKGPKDADPWAAETVLVKALLVQFLESFDKKEAGPRLIGANDSTFRRYARSWDDQPVPRFDQMIYYRWPDPWRQRWLELLAKDRFVIQPKSASSSVDASQLHRMLFAAVAELLTLQSLLYSQSDTARNSPEAVRAVRESLNALKLKLAPFLSANYRAGGR